MALFGDESGLHASHLPMFHPPHDTQLVLDVSIEPADIDARLRRALQDEPRLWTFVPERVDLHALGRGAHPVTSLRGDIVEGHFERGGTVRFADVTLRVSRVVIDRALAGVPSAPTGADYVVMGPGPARFLVKRIDARPDYDHILRIDGCPALVPGASLPKRRSEQREEAERAVRAALPATCADAQIRTIYFEIGDLR